MGSPIGFVPICTAVGLAFILHVALRFRAKLERVSWLSGMRCILSPWGIGAALPRGWWNPTPGVSWHSRKTLYKVAGSETASVVPAFGIPTIYTSNLEVARQIIGGGYSTTFVKPRWASVALLQWGENVIGIEGGDPWRKHRRITGPAFNNDVYKFVWTESVKVYQEMLASTTWSGQHQVLVNSVQDIMFKNTLLIIARCSFGFHFTWDDPPHAGSETMSVQEAFDITARHTFLTSNLPRWVLSLPFEVCKKANKVVDVVGEFMAKQVAERRAEIHAEGVPKRKDLFSMLLVSNEDETKKNRLDDQELIGNVHAMLVAGHETAASALSTTFAFLALYQDVQQEVYEQITSVISCDQAPEFDVFDRLNKVLAVLYESVRLYPPAYIMIREATEDTTLDLPNPVGEQGHTTITVPKGTTVVGDVVGLQYNRRYHADPEVFRPARWYDSDAARNPDAFSAFSFGQRACLGRRFAVTEMVAFVAMFLRDYRVEPLLRDGETLGHWEERVFQGEVFLTLNVGTAQLKFVRRGVDA